MSRRWNFVRWLVIGALVGVIPAGAAMAVEQQGITVNLTIEEPELAIAVNPTQLDFWSLTSDEDQFFADTVTVTNIGNVPIGQVQMAVDPSSMSQPGWELVYHAGAFGPGPGKLAMRVRVQEEGRPWIPLQPDPSSPMKIYDRLDPAESMDVELTLRVGESTPAGKGQFDVVFTVSEN